jgi:hypothetical protein
VRTSAGGCQALINLDALSAWLRKSGLDRRTDIRPLEVVIKTSYVSAASAASEVVAYRVQP